MELLAAFLNRDELVRHITKSMSQVVLNDQHQSTTKEKSIDELSQLFDILPSNIHLDSIPIAGKLFDYLLETNPSLNHYRLLSSCLNVMTVEDRLQRIRTILRTLVDYEQPVALRELLCKLLSTLDPLTSLAVDFDWNSLESAMDVQQDPKFLTYVSRFLSKHHQNRFEQILLRALSNKNQHDELLLLLLIDLRSIDMFVSLPSFWLLIQRSLADATSNNDRIRKCALYLLKQIVASDSLKHIEIKGDQDDRLLILIDGKSKSFWMDFFIVYEALEDGIVHLIKPVLNKFDRLLTQSFEFGLSLTWIFILLQRLFVNTSAPLGRWTIRWFLNSMKLPDRQVETFFVEHVLDWSSNNFVFLKGDEINDAQPMEHYFESFFDRWLESIENRSAKFQMLLSRLQSVKWSHLSLTRILYSIRAFALQQRDQAILHDEHVKLFSTLILTQFHTFAPVLRLSAYSSILDIAISWVDWPISSTSTNLLRFFTLFDRSTFLAKHFHLISIHFTLNIRQLQLSIEEYLNLEPSATSSTDTRLFSLDHDLFQSRQIAFLLDLLDPHNTDVLKNLFYPLMENIRTAYQRPYMSTDHVRRSIELFSALIHETYFHSSNFFKDWLSSSLRSIVREGLNFIKVHSTKQPVAFAKLPTVFLLVGNHGDISRYLQEVLTQIDSLIQQQASDGWQSLFLLFAHSIDWLLKHRWADFHGEWETKLSSAVSFSKIFSLLDQNKKSLSQAAILTAKYIIVSHHVLFVGLNEQIVDDLFKASPKQLPHLFSALGLLLQETNISTEDKCKLLENSLNVVNELDHRMPGYWSCLTSFSQAVSSCITDVTLCNVLTPWFHQMIEKSGNITGLINVIIESNIPVWLRGHCVQSAHLPMIVQCILFGQTYHKDKKQQWQAEQLTEQDESYRSLIIHTQTIPEYRYDRNVRITMQLFLLHIWPSLANVQQHEMIKAIIENHSRLVFQQRRPRFCTNSLEHRLMFRSLQCLLCLTSVIKDSSLLKTIYDHIVETLIHENEPSLRLLAEWIIVRLILEDRTTRLNDLYDCLRDACRHRTGTVCAWISIASHLTNLITDPIEQTTYINRMIEYLSPLLISSNFHIRTFACSTMIKFIESIERHHLEKNTPYETYRWFKQNDEKTELGRYTNKLQSLLLYQFDPIRDFSLETIFYTLPKLSLIADDEYLWPEWFMDISQRFHLTFHISVHNISTLLQSCQPGIWKLTTGAKPEITTNQEEEGSSTIQHKANPYPIVEASDDTEIRKTLHRTQLIVVASLIDKQANLGGLSRTGEIFGVKELVISSIRILEDQQFLSLSMTAHKWLQIKQVQERELKDYLIDMQAQGYTIVAVEQTVNSQNLYQYDFPEKTLLLLGNEREGIRADLLSLVDATVEIPQAGVIRSLNVHVSGALCISEYARKYLHLMK